MEPQVCLLSREELAAPHENPGRVTTVSLETMYARMVAKATQYCLRLGYRAVVERRVLMERDMDQGLSFAAYILLLTLYLTLNSVLNLTNKWALSWFSFPLLLTACHMAFSFLLLLPLMLGPQMRSK